MVTRVFSNHLHTRYDKPISETLARITEEKILALQEAQNLIWPQFINFSVFEIILLRLYCVGLQTMLLLAATSNTLPFRESGFPS